MFPRPSLSISLAGLAPDARAPWAGGARAAIGWASQAGYRWVHLDAAAPGVRPRELDRAARRDLAAFLRRSQLLLSGLDLWIPPEHFIDPGRCDRAVSAVLAAMELAAALHALIAGSTSPAVSVVLPERLPAEVREALESRGEATGARIADHAGFDQPGHDGGSPLGVGIDPAALLLAGRDPAAAASRAGRALVSARLSDATTVGRVAPGNAGGRLDQLAYFVALSTAGYAQPVVVDLRGVAEQDFAARSISSRMATDA
jgi:sugar phosphate isomerase/epimerase